MGASPQTVAERLGKPGRSAKGPVNWFHAAGLGEVAQIGPLAEHLRRSQQAAILVTTIPPTSANGASRS